MICGSAVEFQRSSSEFYREYEMCSGSDLPVAIRLKREIPASVGAELEAIRCDVAGFSARACLIEPRAPVAIPQDDTRDLPGRPIEKRSLNPHLERRASGRVRNVRGNRLISSKSEHKNTQNQQRQPADDQQCLLTAHYRFKKGHVSEPGAIVTRSGRILMRN